jgi:hypothetical protein
MRLGTLALMLSGTFASPFAAATELVEPHGLIVDGRRIADTLFASRTTAAAWKLKPSWYAVSKQKRTTSPELERFLANRMHEDDRGERQSLVSDHSPAGDY